MRGDANISNIKPIEDLILQLKATLTVVIVTHNMEQAARVCDFTAFMYLGELLEVGPAAQMFGTPQQKRTQDYMQGRFG